MAKWWGSQKENKADNSELDLHMFALSVNGVVMLTLGVDKTLAEIYDLNPQIFRCKKEAAPGMTVEEAKI